MISFRPFWESMAIRGISQSKMIMYYGLNPAEVNRLRNGHNFTLKNIDKYCTIFDLQPYEIFEYIPSEEIGVITW